MIRALTSTLLSVAVVSVTLTAQAAPAQQAAPGAPTPIVPATPVTPAQAAPAQAKPAQATPAQAAPGEAAPAQTAAPPAPAGPAATPAPQSPALASAAPEPAIQGAYGDWSLYGYQEDGAPVCYLASRALKSSASIPSRKAPFVLITNRPGEGRRGVVSVVGGYPYQDGSTVTVAIGRRQFHLFTDGDTAWAEDSDDPLLVNSLRGGSALNVSGHTKDGTVVTDGFGLKGFGEALGALDRACPLPGRPVPKAHRKHKKVL